MLPHQIPIQGVTWIITLIFAAGGAWAMFRQTRKDLNGIGARTRRFEKNLLLALMVTTEKREDRELLARFLKD
jgi:hypothetical protein